MVYRFIDKSGIYVHEGLCTFATGSPYRQRSSVIYYIMYTQTHVAPTNTANIIIDCCENIVEALDNYLHTFSVVTPACLFYFLAGCEFCYTIEMYNS